MPRRIITVDGEQWAVAVSGRTTQYVKDEFGLVFTRLAGGPREVRMTRYASLGAKQREAALAQLADADLVRLLVLSQPAWTAPETGYAH